MHQPLASPDNPLVKALLRLHRGRHRAEDGRFLVEGRRAIDGFLRAGQMPEHLLVSIDEQIPPNWPTDRIRPAATRVLTRLSQASTPSGFLASFPLPAATAPDATLGGLCCVGVADPGNLGTLLRTAAAFGVRQVALAGGADPFSHKVVQASAGALAQVHLTTIDGPQPVAGGAPLTALVVQGGITPRPCRAGRAGWWWAAKPTACRPSGSRPAASARRCPCPAAPKASTPPSRARSPATCCCAHDAIHRAQHRHRRRLARSGTHVVPGGGRPRRRRVDGVADPFRERRPYAASPASHRSPTCPDVRSWSASM